METLNKLPIEDVNPGCVAPVLTLNHCAKLHFNNCGFYALGPWSKILQSSYRTDTIMLLSFCPRTKGLICQTDVTFATHSSSLSPLIQNNTL